MTLAKVLLSCGIIIGLDRARAQAPPLTIPDERERAVESLQEKIQESRKGLVEAEAQKRRILGSLYIINKRMRKISSDKGQLTNQLFQVQDNVKAIAKVIAGLEVQIEKQRGHLKRRLRALYKLSGRGYVGMLFSSGSSLELDETLRFLKIVTESDYHLIRSFQQNVVTYKVQKHRLRGQIDKLVVLEKNIKKQEGLLASEHRAKSKIASELDQTKVANLNRIKTLRTKGEKLAGDLSSSMSLSDLLKPSIYEQRGQLTSPVLGEIVQNFGLVTDERYKIRLSHKGWRYATSKAATVTAIFEGTVLFSDLVDGYGETVIVDHGDHYYSLYALIARPRVKTGDSVKRGQALAEAGPPNKRFGDGIYFEIRHFSEPENPGNWIKKKGLHQASIASVSDLITQEIAP
jgi:septal ring factor EnvC (AmiA/AmiB activator)